MTQTAPKPWTLEIVLRGLMLFVPHTGTKYAHVLLVDTRGHPSGHEARLILRPGDVEGNPATCQLQSLKAGPRWVCPLADDDVKLFNSKGTPFSNNLKLIDEGDDSDVGERPSTLLDSRDYFWVFPLADYSENRTLQVKPDYLKAQTTGRGLIARLTLNRGRMGTREFLKIRQGKEQSEADRSGDTDGEDESLWGAAPCPRGGAVRPPFRARAVSLVNAMKIREPKVMLHLQRFDRTNTRSITLRPATQGGVVRVRIEHMTDDEWMPEIVEAATPYVIDPHFCMLYDLFVRPPSTKLAPACTDMRVVEYYRSKTGRTAASDGDVVITSTNFNCIPPTYHGS